MSISVITPVDLPEAAGLLLLKTVNAMDAVAVVCTGVLQRV